MIAQIGLGVSGPIYAGGIIQLVRADPAQNTLIRTMEAEADNYALNTSRQPDGFAQAALHLSEYRKMTPGPIEEWIFYDHPSGWNRIHRSMVWKAEHIKDPDIAAHDAADSATPGLH